MVVKFAPNLTFQGQLDLNFKLGEREIFTEHRQASLHHNGIGYFSPLSLYDPNKVYIVV